MKEQMLSTRVVTGTVVSAKMAKTVVVEVSRTFKHPQFDKILRTSKCYKAHYEDSASVQIGDMVEMREGRPVSKTKYMYVTKVVSKRKHA